VPIEPSIPSPPPEHNHDDINARLDELMVMIEAIPAGRTGDTGQKGEPGIQGEPGEDGVCDPTTFTDEQVAALAKRLPPMTFVPVDSNGKPIGTPASARLGQTVGLHSFLLTPKPADKPQPGITVSESE
jgi:hypothetical protein